MSISNCFEMLKMGSKPPQHERWEVRDDIIGKMIGWQGIQHGELKMVEAGMKETVLTNIKP